MTVEEVVQKLTLEAVMITDDTDHIDTYRRIIKMALTIGLENETKSTQEIVQLDMEGEELGRYSSVEHVSLETGIHETLVLRALSGLVQTAGGYGFVLKTEKTLIKRNESKD